MAHTFGISRGSYYKQRGAPLSKRNRSKQIAQPIIIKAFLESKSEYGARRIQKALKAKNINMGRKRIGAIMKSLGLTPIAKRKFKVTTQQSSRPYYVAPNLINQNFTAAAPNEVWVGDITYVPTAQGWLYVATVIDLFSRKVVGMAMSQRIKTDLVLRAVNQAVRRRKPKPGLIMHSDRGSQYTSRAYSKLAKKHQIKLSMSGKGCCYDNAVAESFFHTLKIAVFHGQKYETRDQATRCIFSYVEGFYNQKRMHSTLGYMSPDEFEQNHINQPIHPIANCSLNG